MGPAARRGAVRRSGLADRFFGELFESQGRRPFRWTIGRSESRIQDEASLADPIISCPLSGSACYAIGPRGARLFCKSNRRTAHRWSPPPRPSLSFRRDPAAILFLKKDRHDSTFARLRRRRSERQFGLAERCCAYGGAMPDASDSHGRIKRYRPLPTGTGMRELGMRVTGCGLRYRLCYTPTSPPPYTRMCIHLRIGFSLYARHTGTIAFTLPLYARTNITFS